MRHLDSKQLYAATGPSCPPGNSQDDARDQSRDFICGVSSTTGRRPEIRAELNCALQSIQTSRLTIDTHNDHDDGTTSNATWCTVHDLLMELGSPRNVIDNENQLHQSSEEDPFGRTFLTRLVSRNPPFCCLDAALRAFPDAVCSTNPVVFFSACSHSSLEVVTRMTQHIVHRRRDRQECPYPWILSSFISLEAAQAMLSLYPQGVWETSTLTPFLKDDSCRSSYTPLDYLLFSKTMVQCREFDETLWNKFKLILVTAEYSSSSKLNTCEISPVHTLLDRIVARPDCFDDPERAQHILWLLHQLRSSDEWIFQKQRAHLNYDDLFPLHLLLSRKCFASTQSAMVAVRELCKIIIKADTLAVMYGVSTDEQVYPLHMAVANGWPCHDLLLAAWPESIGLVDPRTGLLPFQTAAAASSTSLHTSSLSNSSVPNFGLDMAFELLKADPNMVSSCKCTNQVDCMDTTPIDDGGTAVVVGGDMS